LREDDKPIGLEELVLRREKCDAIINQDEQLKTLHQNLTSHQKKTAIIQLIENLSPIQFETLLNGIKPENRAQFKRNLWTSYVQQSEYTTPYLEEYEHCKNEIERIERAAAKDLPIWEKAVERFNARFVGMPYTLDIPNSSDAALGRATPSLKFIFNDGEKTSIQNHTDVESKKILSGGERRVFYLLNFIFEVESRKRDERETLFIIDDPADSFDYKNKHAILQYLADLNDVPHFHQIILTHNYDFFRALITNGKGVVTNAGLLMANKSKDGRINLEVAKDGIRNYFNGMLKNNVTGNDTILCATIPFSRNLIEYAKGEEDSSYSILTSLLHWRKDTEQISVKQYLDIYNDFFHGVTAMHTHQEKPVIELIFEQADLVRKKSERQSLALEEKMVLSIAIRITAERFLTQEFRRLKNTDDWLTKPFGRVLNDYLHREPNSKHRKCLERASMIVNSNIHLNAFMYEPIIDLGIETLIDLYDQVMKLSPPNGD
jgi:wobble nucleotide-excising tRNase